MTINILTFGVAKEILGSGSVVLQSDDALTAWTLKADLEQKYPGLKKLSSFMIAVNGEYATTETTIKSGDEIAIIPPVSGG